MNQSRILVIMAFGTNMPSPRPVVLESVENTGI